MVREGSAGTYYGDGLAQTINRKLHIFQTCPTWKYTDLYAEATSWYGVTNSRAFYIAARLYNSGSVDPSGNLQDGIATHCYSSDIANRLTGWVSAAHGCYL